MSLWISCFCYESYRQIKSELIFKMNSFYSGPSIKLYGKLRNWFNFDKNNVLQVYSGKIDIGQHISSTLALISSKITGINYDQVEIIKLDTDISPNEGKTASSLSVPDSGSAIKAASLSLRKAFCQNSKTPKKTHLFDKILFIVLELHNVKQKAI